MDTPFGPKRNAARAIDWDQIHAEFIMVRGHNRSSDTEYMAATDQTPEDHETLATQEPSIHGSRTMASAPARLIEGGLPTEGTLAHIVVSK